MIPKIIHYCWFGRGKKSPLIKKCIRSWKRFCPDWQIIEWNEDNFDINSALWTKQAYEAKKYAFVSDYVRLKALCEIGGVYLDTDEELIKPLEQFRQHGMFLGFLGAENISAGLIGSEKEHFAIKKMLSYYENRSFRNADGSEDTQPNTDWMTNVLLDYGLKKKNGLQVLGNIVVYPKVYFCPTSCISVEDKVGAETVAVHHWAMTWRTPQSRKNMKRVKFHTTRFYRTWEWIKVLPQKIFRKIFGDDAMEKLKKKLGK